MESLLNHISFLPVLQLQIFIIIHHSFCLIIINGSEGGGGGVEVGVALILNILMVYFLQIMLLNPF